MQDRSIAHTTHRKINIRRAGPPQSARKCWTMFS
jgi:hypothetical protein